MKYPIDLLDWKITSDREGKGTVYAHQVHGANIVRAKDAQKETLDADGIYIEDLKLPVGIKTADCMPLVLVGEGRALLLHVSRKTLIAGQLEQIPRHILPNEIQAIYIGPHICENHFMFEWEGEEVKMFRTKFPAAIQEKNNILHLSLRKAVQQYIDEWNIMPEIVEDKRCTYEHRDLPSYTRWLEQGKKGKLQQLTTNIQKII